jgi:hypothetical protein
MSDNGNAVAPWQRATQTIAYTVNLFRNGAWGTPQTLFDVAPASAFFGPVLSGSRNGAALVAWASTAGRGSTLAGSTLSGTTWRIENDDAGDATAPSVAVDSRGNAQAVWQQFDGMRINVISDHFD